MEDESNLPIPKTHYFSKAFDTVDYRTLLAELHAIGFSVKLLYLFKDYLSNRRQLVQIDDKTSEKLQIEFGVPQGSILGPVLFNLYVRTISSNGRSYYLLYAEDTTMLRHTKVVNLPNAIEEIQHEIIIIIIIIKDLQIHRPQMASTNRSYLHIV